MPIWTDPDEQRPLLIETDAAGQVCARSLELDGRSASLLVAEPGTPLRFVRGAAQYVLQPGPGERWVVRCEAGEIQLARR